MKQKKKNALKNRNTFTCKRSDVGAQTIFNIITLKDLWVQAFLTRTSRKGNDTYIYGLAKR